MRGALSASGTPRKRKGGGIGKGATCTYVRRAVPDAWSVINGGWGGERGRRAAEGARCSTAARIGGGGPRGPVPRRPATAGGMGG